MEGYSKIQLRVNTSIPASIVVNPYGGEVFGNVFGDEVKIPYQIIQLDIYDKEEEWILGEITIFHYTQDDVGINELPANLSSLSIYPNPAKNELRVEKVEVLNLSGKTVSVFNNAGNRIDVSHLPAGIYFIKIETGKGSVTKKFVKE